MGGSNSLENTRRSKVYQRDKNLKQHLQMIDSQLTQLNLNNTFAQKIIHSSVTELVGMLNQGIANSQQIVASYAKRAGVVGVKLCLITEDNFAEAMQLAVRFDDIRRTSGKRNWTFGDPYDMEKFLPPLFGIPISIKDTIDMKGFASTIGLTHRANRIQQNDGTMVQGIKNSGMIPFVRTNVPQLAMTFQSNNYLWGRAVNPWNVERAVGGSSGGEGALIAARGSPIGVGSDIGGSLRIPADFCGICSLKPGSGRISFKGHTPYIDSFDGNPIVPAIMGPMARGVEDLALWMKSITDKEMYRGLHDPRIFYIPFDDKKYIEAQKTRYRIGYIQSFDICQSTVTSQRAVKEATDALREFGHQMVQIKMPNEKEVMGSFLTFLTGQGDLQSFRLMLENEQFVPEYKFMAFVSRLGAKCYCCFCCIKGIMDIWQPRLGWSLQAVAKRTTHEYMMNAGAIKRYREEWLNYLRKENIDFVIVPGFGSQATINGDSNDCALPACYTYCWNLLDVPAGSVPVTLVRNDEQNYDSRHQDDFTKALKKNAWNSEGLPAGIQVVGFPYDQERVLAIMKIIQQKVKFTEKYGSPKV